MDASEFTDEQIEALQALADGYNDQSVSRRDVMKLVGAGGVGALLGGGGMAGAVGQARAGTAQSGQLGAIGDPLDLVVEDLKDGQGNTVASANAGALEGTSLRYESVNADQARINSLPRSYDVHTDGSTVWAEPQDSLFAYKDGDDIGVLLDDIIINELQPQGSQLQAAGRIRLKSYPNGPYPGSLSNGEVDGLLITSGLQLHGEASNFPRSGPGNTVPTEATKDNIVLQSDSYGLVTPNINTGLLPWIRVQDLMIQGPGAGTSGTIGVSGVTNSNRWDWFQLNRVAVYGFERGFDTRDTHHINVKYSIFDNMQSAIIGGDKQWWTRNQFFSERTGSHVRIDEDTQYQHTRLRDNLFLLNPVTSGIDSLNSIVVLDIRAGNNILATGNRIENQDNQGGGLRVIADGDVTIKNNNFQSAFGQGSNTIPTAAIAGPGTEKYISNIHDATENVSLEVNGVNGLTDPTIRDNTLPNGITEVNSPTRPRYDGTIYLSGSPTTSNYGSDDAGIEIIDTSISPADIYRVDVNGSVLGPL